MSDSTSAGPLEAATEITSGPRLSSCHAAEAAQAHTRLPASRPCLAGRRPGGRALWQPPGSSLLVLSFMSCAVG